MYNLLRNIHLYLGLASCLFLLMYGVSAIQMSHPDWFANSAIKSQTTVRIEGASPDGRAVARELMDKHGLRGELRRVSNTPSGFSLAIGRPGTDHTVEYNRSTGEAKIATRTAPFIGMLNGIHHVAGMWHTYGVLNWWGVCVLAVSAGLFVIAGTGVYLWFKLRPERRTGAVLLVFSLAYSVTVIILLRTA